MIQRCAGNPCHQAFRVRIIEFAEGDVRPSRDHGTLAHCCLLSVQPLARIWRTQDLGLGDGGRGRAPVPPELACLSRPLASPDNSVANRNSLS
ncbi:hypothetical protein G6F22_021853 [Rhizopus arrhizus]|nr:hypothetical protein G6F22_021853 [Rhizopus arrhizus]